MKIRLLIALFAFATVSSSSFAYYNNYNNYNYNTFYQHQQHDTEIQIVGKMAGINNIEVKIANKSLPVGHKYVLTCAGLNQPAISTSNGEAYYYGKYLKFNLSGLKSDEKYRCQIAIEGKSCNSCGDRETYQYNQSEFFFISTKERSRQKLSIHSTSSQSYRSSNCCGSNCRVYKNPYAERFYSKNRVVGCQQEVENCKRCVTDDCHQRCGFSSNCERGNSNYVSPFFEPTNTRSDIYRINTRARNYYYY